MKTCTKCQQTKEITEFYKKSDSKSGFQSICKQCLIKLNQDRYKTNKNKTQKQAQNACYKLRSITNDIKTKYGCCVCFEKTPCCLDFHHLDGDTKDNIVSNLVALKNKVKLIEEINKCCVLCANCHRKYHNGLIKLDNYIQCNENILDHFLVIGHKVFFK